MRYLAWARPAGFASLLPVGIASLLIAISIAVFLSFISSPAVACDPHDISCGGGGGGAPADVTAPTFDTFPGDIIIATDPGELTQTVTWFEPTATDDVDGVVVPAQTGGNANGGLFPIGVTAVTYAIGDFSGNVHSQSFNVIVTPTPAADTTPPTFDSFPSDIVVDADPGGTTKTVSWTEPSANDDVDGAIDPSQTAGGANGSAFSVGTTTVSYKAADSSGNSTSRSFSVTVNAAALADVSMQLAMFVQNLSHSDVYDGTLVLTANNGTKRTEPTVIGGSGQRYLPVSGGFSFRSFTVSVEAGWTISNLDCPASDIVTISGDTVTLKDSVTTGSSLLCTLDVKSGTDAANTQEKTAEIVQSTIMTRSEEISLTLLSTPIRRLDVIDSLLSSIQVDFSAPGLSVVVEAPDALAYAPTARVAAQPGSAAEALTDLDAGVLWNSERAENDLFGFWLEGNAGIFEDNGSTGGYGILHTGVDFKILPNVLTGVSLQLDAVQQSAGSQVSGGKGFMAGTYLTAKLSDNFYFDGTASWGKNFNSISPFGTYTDYFATSRWLLTASLIGDFDVMEYKIRPAVGLSFYDETSDAYTSTPGPIIPSARVGSGAVTFSPTISRDVALEGGTLTPALSLSGSWQFYQAGSSSQSITGTARGSLSWRSQDGLVLNGSLSYGGIFDPNAQSLGASVSARTRF